MKKLFRLINKNLLNDFFARFKKEKIISKNHPLITISREKGSGGRPIAYLVEKKLGKPWKVYHEEIVDEIGRETHLEKELVKEIDEVNIPMIEEIIADFFGRRYLNLGTYYKSLIKILSTIGHRGNAIIVGRGAEYLFPNALKIRIICEMEQRIKWMMQYEKISKHEAERQIEESDRKRGDFLKAAFNHDPKKAHHYDLVIRTGHALSIKDAADLIVFAAKRRFKI